MTGQIDGFNIIIYSKVGLSEDLFEGDTMKIKKTVFYSGLIVLFFFIACTEGATPPPDAPVYYVTYQGNGSTSGSVPVDISAYKEGDHVTVLDNYGNLARISCKFSAWNTAADGTGTGYAEGEVFTMGDDDVVLYARWAETYKVTYLGNGNTAGTVPVDGSSYVEGEQVRVIGNTGKLLNIDGETIAYIFDGWNTDENGTGDSRAAGSTFIMGVSDVALHAHWIPYSLRDRGPAGGYVFYIAPAYTGGWRYLEAAPEPAEQTAVWSDPHASFIGTSSSIGSGRTNTDDIVSALDTAGETGRAAQLCDELSFGGCSDWFLPSSLELDEMEEVLASYSTPVGDFSEGSYWSSTEYNASEPYWIDFPGGDPEYGEGKGEEKYIRAVRSF